MPCELSGSTVMCVVDVDRLGAGEWTVDPAPGFERVIYEHAPASCASSASSPSRMRVTLSSPFRAMMAKRCVPETAGCA